MAPQHITFNDDFIAVGEAKGVQSGVEDVFLTIGAVIEVIEEVCVLAAAEIHEPRCEKTGLRGFRPGPTQTRLHDDTR